MNEKGFSWTRAWVVPNEPEATNKMNAVDWFLKMGSTVSTVDEAIKFVQGNPKGIGDQGNYIFADADGNMAAVEVGYQTVNVVQKWTKGEQGVVARANLWTSDKMKPIDISNTADEHDHQCAVSTGYRVPRAMDLLNGGKGKINVDTLKQILADNNNRDKAALGDTGFSISNHGATGGTVAAEVYDPANRTFWFTYGWPDGDAKSSNPSFDGANKNTWGAWIPFIISEMAEEGYYTDWNGNITPMGALSGAFERKAYALIRAPALGRPANLRAYSDHGGGGDTRFYATLTGWRVAVNRVARYAPRGPPEVLWSV